MYIKDDLSQREHFFQMTAQLIKSETVIQFKFRSACSKRHCANLPPGKGKKGKERKQGFKINVSKITILNALHQNSVIKAGTVTHRQALLKRTTTVLKKQITSGLCLLCLILATERHYWLNSVN